jgi:protein arginine kinase activator
MTCQRCQDEASVHLTESVDGQLREVHLCGRCAREAGVVTAASGTPPDLGLDAVLQGLIVAHVGELVGELAQCACPDCGLRFMEFRATGRLGCPADYEVFGRGLLPLLRRTHGATRHVGKAPARGAARPEARGDSTGRLRLRARLRKAIAREDYEEAARLRDQLRPKDVPV